MNTFLWNFNFQVLNGGYSYFMVLRKFIKWNDDNNYPVMWNCSRRNCFQHAKNIKQIKGHIQGDREKEAIFQFLITNVFIKL